MGLTDYISRHARKPEGRFGRLFAMSMNLGHLQVTQWGLGHININKTDTILDVGCGGGKTINQLAGIATKGKVLGIDYSETSVAVATSINKKYIETGHVEIAHASVDVLPFSDNMFDMVTAIETCYFWPDMTNNLREIRRVLKPGGTLLIINECYKDEAFEKRNSTWAKAGNFNYYMPDEFKTFLKNAGYSYIKIDVIPAKNWLIATGEKDDD
jgi:ubiquinone/menaquinone biosynthesis C-methylase UbiE